MHSAWIGLSSFLRIPNRYHDKVCARCLSRGAFPRENSDFHVIDMSRQVEFLGYILATNMVFLNSLRNSQDLGYKSMYNK